MYKREFTDAEIAHIKQFATVNERKSAAQEIIIDFFATVKALLLTAHTRFGKAYLLLRLIERYRKVSSGQITLVVSNTNVEAEMKSLLGHFENVFIFVVNSYAAGSLPAFAYQNDILIIDEIHHVLNPDAGMFGQTIPRSRFKRLLGLSATVDTPQKAQASKLGFTHEFHVPLKTGVRLEIIPAYQSLNIPITLTTAEQQKYQQLNQQISNRLRLFERIDVDKASRLAFGCCPSKTNSASALQLAAYIGIQLSMSTESVMGSAINYRTEIGKRANLMYQAANKITKSIKIIDQLSDQKILLFGSRMSMGDELARRVSGLTVYRNLKTASGQQKIKKQLAAFNQGKNPYLYSCKTLVEGFTVNDCGMLIDLGITSKQRRDIQVIGRLLGMAPGQEDKLATKINLYVDDFKNQAGETISSVEKQWLLRAQKQMLFTHWLDDTDDLVDYLPAEAFRINEPLYV